MFLSNTVLVAVLVLVAAGAATLGAIALSAVGLAWYVAPVAVVAYFASQLRAGR